MLSSRAKMAQGLWAVTQSRMRSVVFFGMISVPSKGSINCFDKEMLLICVRFTSFGLYPAESIDKMYHLGVSNMRLYDKMYEKSDWGAILQRSDRFLQIQILLKSKLNPYEIML